VLVCILALGIQHAKRIFPTEHYVYISTLSHKRHDFREE